MQLTKTHKIIISVVIIAVLFFVYVAFDKKSRDKQRVVETENATQSTTTAANNIQVSVQGTGNYTITQVPVTGGQNTPEQRPDLNRAVHPTGSANVSTDSLVVATKKILELQALLKKNPADFSAWLDLGIYQKIAGDYAGAVITWTYASKLAPTDYISLGNLGNLYAYFIKDNTKAEMYYKQAISKGSTQAILYVQLAEVYRDIFHDNGKALTIIEQGLKQIPNDANLLRLKASLSTSGI
jgi:hypothetical protein